MTQEIRISPIVTVSVYRSRQKYHFPHNISPYPENDDPCNRRCIQRQFHLCHLVLYPYCPSASSSSFPHPNPLLYRISISTLVFQLHYHKVLHDSSELGP